jgi:hypothetical protein
LQARLYHVRQDYTRVRGDLQSLEPDPDMKAYWQRASDQLQDARLILDSLRPDARAAAGAISQADQALVWITGEDALQVRAGQLMDQLRTQGLTTSVDRLTQARVAPDATGQEAVDSHWRRLAGAVDDAIGELADAQQDVWINTDLQVARLRLLTIYVGGALLLTLAATTIAANPAPVHGWPVHQLTALPSAISSLLASAAVAVLGAAGGLFSGLLATQGAATTLLGYRTSVLRLILKPLVGALVACVLYIGLSWQVIPGVTVSNGGTFLVLGFVTGFSERYILRLLNVNDHADDAAGHGTARSAADSGQHSEG